MNIGKSLKIVMAVKSLNLQRLSDECGISRGHLSCISTGKKSPTVGSLKSICDATGYSVSDFIKLGEEEKIDIAS